MTCRGGGIDMDNEVSSYIENSIDWAKQKLGSVEYQFLCLAFVEDAYEKGNNVEIFGGSTAKESADEYRVWNNTGVPPLGAFVFMIVLELYLMNTRIMGMLVFILVRGM
jgi:hypothetical protein